MSIEDLKQLQRELKSITQQLEAFSKLNCVKPETLSEAENILKKLPSGDTFGRALNEWKTKAQATIDKIKQERKESFGRILAEFIRTAQAQNIPTREFDQSWRVGPLEVQIRRESSQTQIVYNQQIISKWSSVASADDIKKLYDSAMHRLTMVTIPIGVLIEVFWDAYDYLKHKQAKVNNPQPAMVPLKSFYRMWLSLMSYASHEKKVQPQEFPVWAFLYNLDIYRDKSSEVPIERRLGLQTGTQSQSSSMGMVTNGLDANQDYRTYCYIYAVEGQR